MEKNKTFLPLARSLHEYSQLHHVTEMPSGYAVGRTDADSPRAGFLLQGFAVCMEGEEDEAAVYCGPRAIPNLGALSPKRVQPLYYGKTYI